jgi:hypothetical protein
MILYDHLKSAVLKTILIQGHLFCDRYSVEVFSIRWAFSVSSLVASFLHKINLDKLQDVLKAISLLLQSVPQAVTAGRELSESKNVLSFIHYNN